MKRLALLLVLAACEPADGYRFEQRERSTDAVQVHVIEHSDHASLLSAAQAIGATEDGRETMAFALLAADGRSCTIHVVAPERQWSPEWYGHELGHCLWGRWHR